MALTEDSNQERDVGDTLDAFDPAPADGLVDEASVDGRGYGTEDSDETEHGHGTAALLSRVHVVESTTDENSTNTTKETEKETQTDDGVDIRGKREADEE